MTGVSVMAGAALVLGILAGIVGTFGVMEANSAPQQAAAAAIACAIAVIPYVVARCVEMISNASDRARAEKLAALKQQQAEIERQLRGA